MESIDIARICHDANRAICIVNDDPALPPWDEALDAMRVSTVTGVDHVNDRILQRPLMQKFWNAAAEQHEAWMHTKLDEGWTHGPVKDWVAKTHPNLVPWAELPEAQRRKDLLFVMIVTACRAETPER